jgi:nucleotide-binding universal stress UspA family protein
MGAITDNSGSDIATAETRRERQRKEQFMTLRHILVPMLGTVDDAPALSTALGIAKSGRAHVEALFLAADPRQAAIYGDYMSPTIFDRIMAETEADNTRRRKLTSALLTKLIGEHAVPLRDQPVTPEEPSAAYVERTGEPSGLVVDAGRLSDLIVLNLPKQFESSSLLEAVLRDSGKPVLLVPRAMPAGFAKTIAIAWNGSVQAARAVGFAMPLLERAANVVVLTVDGERLYGPTAEELVSALSWHGIPAAASVLPASSQSQGDVLLAAAGRNSADLMVLGAYTRGELRRLVFGGVTGELLAKSSIPLYMVH